MVASFNLVSSLTKQATFGNYLIVTLVFWFRFFFFWFRIFVFGLTLVFLVINHLIVTLVALLAGQDDEVAVPRLVEERGRVEVVPGPVGGHVHQIVLTAAVGGAGADDAHILGEEQ